MTRRVLYFHHGGAIGGAPLSLLYLLQRIDRREYEPVVLTLRPGPMSERFAAAGIETHVCPDVSDFSHTTLEWYGGRDGWWRLPAQVARFRGAVAAARRHIRRFAPRLVHLNSSTLAAAARAARLEGVPTVWHVREPLAAGYLGLRRSWLRRRIHEDGERVIAISRHDAAQLQPSDRTRVIYNFVDFGHFRPMPFVGDARTAAGADGRRMVLMLGGVSYPKGTLTLVQAASLLRRSHPDALFVVAGAPPRRAAGSALARLGRGVLGVDAYDARVKAAAAELESVDALRFVGVQPDVVPLVAASDLLVFPSSVPHFGRPLIEAAAMARPTVASDHGSARELVADGETGLLVPPNDPRALAAAIARVLDDPVRGRAMGEAGYRRARRLFDAERNARATYDVYREILP